MGWGVPPRPPCYLLDVRGLFVVFACARNGHLCFVCARNGHKMSCLSKALGYKMSCLSGVDRTQNVVFVWHATKRMLDSPKMVGAVVACDGQSRTYAHEMILAKLDFLSHTVLVS